MKALVVVACFLAANAEAQEWKTSPLVTSAKLGAEQWKQTSATSLPILDGTIWIIVTFWQANDDMGRQSTARCFTSFETEDFEQLAERCAIAGHGE